MTAELSGRALDYAIAEAKSGGRRCDCGELRENCDCTPRYRADIAAAWPLLKEMAAAGVRVHLMADGLGNYAVGVVNQIAWRVLWRRSAAEAIAGAYLPWLAWIASRREGK
mgnify:CR=1 FL=1